MNTRDQAEAAKEMALKAAELSKMAARAYLRAMNEHAATFQTGLPNAVRAAQEAADLATDAYNALKWA